MSDRSRLPPEVKELVNRIGEFMQYWGFKRLHGQIWALLFLSSRPLDAADLMHRLKVSKASISLSLQTLKDYEVVREASKSEKGTQTYEAHPEIANAILNVLRRRERPMISEILMSHQMLEKMPSNDRDRAEIDPAKIKSMGKLIEAGQTILELVAKLECLKKCGF